MKNLILTILLLSVLTACAQVKYLVSKSECDEMGEEFLLCKKVFKVK